MRVGIHQGSILSPFIFAGVMYVVDEEITFDPGINIPSCNNVLECVFKKRLGKMVEIREEQYGFVAG